MSHDHLRQQCLAAIGRQTAYADQLPAGTPTNRLYAPAVVAVDLAEWRGLLAGAAAPSEPELATKLSDLRQGATGAADALEVTLHARDVLAVLDLQPAALQPGAAPPAALQPAAAPPAVSTEVWMGPPPGDREPE